MTRRTYAETYLKEPRINFQGHRLDRDEPFVNLHIYRTIPQGGSVVMSWRERHARWLRGGRSEQTAN